MGDLQTPVVMILFNRPDLTRQIFAAIRAARPAHLLLVADGPRPNHPGDEPLCAAARAVVAQVDWPCHVERNYAETNLGCDFRVVSGLDWAFAQVETAIILEDDVLPDLTFFPYCQDLLARFREDEQVLGIGGYNALGEWDTGEGSYVIHRLPAIYGWATWRRAWRHFDRTMARYQGWDVRDRLTAHVRDADMVAYWWQLYNHFQEISIAPWDIQLSLICGLMGAYWISPRTNLVTNIGFDERATRTRMDDDLRKYLQHGAMSFPLTHPRGAVEDAVDDRFDRWVYLLLTLNSYRNVAALWAWQRAMVQRPDLTMPGIVGGGRPYLAPLRQPAELLAVLDHAARAMNDNPRLTALRATLAKLAVTTQANHLPE